jgi:serine beta-lactamase-like protein LACTB
MDPIVRWQMKIAIVFIAVTGFLVVGAGVIYFVLVINPVYKNAAEVPSTANDLAPGQYTATAEKVRPLVRKLLFDDNVPGISMAVAVNGKIVWAEAFGYADVESHTPLTPETRFRIGSVSKTLTAAGVALLHDRGRIDLDAAVQRYVPSYPQKKWTITPYQLLGDVAGVHRIFGDNNDRPPFGHCTTLKESLQKFSDEPLLFEPGTNYRFASNGWVLLSAVVEGAAEEPFNEFMSREVLAPLGMTRTMLEGTDSNADLVMHTESMDIMWRKLGLESEQPDSGDYSCFFGAGGFLSTPSDLVRLGSAMLQPGFLKEKTLATFQEPLKLKSGASSGFSMGWRVDTIEFDGAQVQVLRHRAIPFAGPVTLTVFPAQRLVIASATNGSDLDTVDPFTLKIAEQFAKVPGR